MTGRFHARGRTEVTPARGSTAASNEPAPKSLCACVSDDAARCLALRYPYAASEWDETDVERCECSCHDFASYDE